MFSHIIAYITVKDAKEAQNIANVLLDDKIVACCNIINDVKSLYMWNGNFCNEDEVVLIAKTKASLQEMLIQKVKSLHSYDVPCIIFMPIIGGNKEFLDWIDSETIS